MQNKNQISLYLMTYKGLRTLQSLIDHGLSKVVSYVVIGTDKNTLNDYSLEMKNICRENNIVFFSKSDKVPFETNYIITVSWRWLINDANSRLIIFHESLLPKYRGFAPLVNQLINKEKFIGLSAIFGEKDYDTGDIIAQEKLEINYPIKVNNAIHLLADLYEKLVIKICNEIVNRGRISNTYPQLKENVSYSLWRDEDDYAIDWTKSADYINRFIDAVGFPYKGASTKIESQLIRIVTSNVLPDVIIENRDPGKIIFFKDNKPVVVCGEGLLQLEEAYYDESEESIFPLPKFRIKFK